MTGQHFIDRRPRSESCPRCGRLQLNGVDEGLPYRVSPMPLTLEAELAAHLNGRRSYAIRGDYVTYRDAMRMRGDVRGRPTVIATHDCFAVIKPEHFDPRPSATTEITRILALASRATETQPVISAQESDALFAVSETLGGLIISQEPAPF